VYIIIYFQLKFLFGIFQVSIKLQKYRTNSNLLFFFKERTTQQNAIHEHSFRDQILVIKNLNYDEIEIHQW